MGIPEQGGNPIEGPYETPDTAWTTIFDSIDRGVSIGGAQRLLFELDNDEGGGAALSDFRVQIKPHVEAIDWHTWLVKADFETPYGDDVLWVSDDTLPACPSGERHAAQIALPAGCYAFRMQGMTAAGSAKCLIRGTLANEA